MKTSIHMAAETDAPQSTDQPQTMVSAAQQAHDRVQLLLDREKFHQCPAQELLEVVIAQPLTPSLWEKVDNSQTAHWEQRVWDELLAYLSNQLKVLNEQQSIPTGALQRPWRAQWDKVLHTNIVVQMVLLDDYWIHGFSDFWSGAPEANALWQWVLRSQELSPSTLRTMLNNSDLKEMYQRKFRGSALQWLEESNQNETACAQVLLEHQLLTAHQCHQLAELSIIYRNGRLWAWLQQLPPQQQPSWQLLTLDRCGKLGSAEYLSPSFMEAVITLSLQACPNQDPKAAEHFLIDMYARSEGKVFQWENRRWSLAEDDTHKYGASLNVLLQYSGLCVPYVLEECWMMGHAAFPSFGDLLLPALTDTQKNEYMLAHQEHPSHFSQWLMSTPLMCRHVEREALRAVVPHSLTCVRGKKI